jgi:hypothetical protein
VPGVPLACRTCEAEVADLKTGVARDPGAPGPGTLGRAGRAAASLRAGLRAAGRAARPAALWRQHRLMTIAVLLALVPRILAAASFRPALLTADSFLYMSGAVTHTLGSIRPSGYSFFLGAVGILPRPLLAVTVLQHLMGLAIAVIVYALLRYWGLPGWGATLAALPVLFDVREIALESYVLPDTVFALVIIVMVALLLTRRTPRWWQCGAAGLLLAYACVLRGNGLPLAVVAAVFLLIRKVGWKSLAAAAAAFAVPLLGYVAMFHATYGAWNLTTSDGIFLWSRTTSFASCAVIRPPAQLRPLCPDRAAGITVPAPAAWSVPHLLAAPTPSTYLWSAGAWWRHDAHPGIDRYNNRLGQRFAVAALTAQPLDYLRVVGRDVLLTFAATDRPQGASSMTFTPTARIPVLPSYYRADERAYAGTTENTHAVAPWSFWLFLYQQPVVFPGPLFLAVIVAGLAGVLRSWRRWGGVAVLPWALAAVSILSPALLTQSLYRYVIVAIPLACLAAGLACTRPRPPRAAPEPSAPQATCEPQEPGLPAEPPEPSQPREPREPREPAPPAATVIRQEPAGPSATT